MDSFGYDIGTNGIFITRRLIMDARSAMRPCYILPMFFLYFFYGRLSWPNG